MSSQPIKPDSWSPPIRLRSLSDPDSKENKLLYVREKLMNLHRTQLPPLISEGSCPPILPNLIAQVSRLSPAPAAALDSIESDDSSINLSDIDMRITTLQMSILYTMPDKEIIDRYNELISIKKLLGTTRDQARDAIIDDIENKLKKFLAPPKPLDDSNQKNLSSIRNASISKRTRAPDLVEKIKKLSLS